MAITKSGRRVGNTTRQIDEIIQQLFEGGKVFVRDHHVDGTDDSANRRLADKVIYRLTIEHESIHHSGGIKYNASENSIWLSSIWDDRIGEPTNKAQLRSGFGFKLKWH